MRIIPTAELSISIHKALAGLDRGYYRRINQHRWISIHKALAGLDSLVLPFFISCLMISIHKALAGLDPSWGGYWCWDPKFQSTRPSRASTGSSLSSLGRIAGISIHKALAGLDVLLSFCPVLPEGFQSTRPSRASTLRYMEYFGTRIFQSTRPSRASTTCREYDVGNGCDFNPQGPRGPRLKQFL